MSTILSKVWKVRQGFQRRIYYDDDYYYGKSGKASKGEHYDDTITTVSLVSRDPRVIMMMTTTIPREARVDTMMTDMVAREVNWGSCAFLITPNVILIPQIVAVRVLLAPWRLMMALSFVENPTLPLIQS